MHIKSQEITFYTHQTGKNFKVPKYQMLAKMWSNRTFTHCWWECKLVQPLWKIIWLFFSKLYGTYILWLSTSLLEKYPMKAHKSVPGTSSKMSTETLLTTAKILTIAQMSTDKRNDKYNVIQSYNEIPYSSKKWRNTGTCINMDKSHIYNTEPKKSKAQNTYSMISLILILKICKT